MLIPVCAETNASFSKTSFFAIRPIFLDVEQENKAIRNGKRAIAVKFFITSIYKYYVMRFRKNIFSCDLKFCIETKCALLFFVKNNIA
jgi:hypothetical protein